jgi:hypothetical protein
LRFPTSILLLVSWAILILRSNRSYSMISSTSSELHPVIHLRNLRQLTADLNTHASTFEVGDALEVVHVLPVKRERL